MTVFTKNLLTLAFRPGLGYIVQVRYKGIAEHNSLCR